MLFNTLNESYKDYALQRNLALYFFFYFKVETGFYISLGGSWMLNIAVTKTKTNTKTEKGIDFILHMDPKL